MEVLTPLNLLGHYLRGEGRAPSSPPGEVSVLTTHGFHCYGGRGGLCACSSLMSLEGWAPYSAFAGVGGAGWQIFFL